MKTYGLSESRGGEERGRDEDGGTHVDGGDWLWERRVVCGSKEGSVQRDSGDSDGQELIFWSVCVEQECKMVLSDGRRVAARDDAF